jgi:hypothetical protein
MSFSSVSSQNLLLATITASMRKVRASAKRNVAFKARKHMTFA